MNVPWLTKDLLRHPHKKVDAIGPLNISPFAFLLAAANYIITVHLAHLLAR
jgi:hypothetical protein